MRIIFQDEFQTTRSTIRKNFLHDYKVRAKYSSASTSDIRSERRRHKAIFTIKVYQNFFPNCKYLTSFILIKIGGIYIYLSTIPYHVKESNKQRTKWFTLAKSAATDCYPLKCFIIQRPIDNTDGFPNKSCLLGGKQ